MRRVRLVVGLAVFFLLLGAFNVGAALLSSREVPPRATIVCDRAENRCRWGGDRSPQSLPLDAIGEVVLYRSSARTAGRRYAIAIKRKGERQPPIYVSGQASQKAVVGEYRTIVARWRKFLDDPTSPRLELDYPTTSSDIRGLLITGVAGLAVGLGLLFALLQAHRASRPADPSSS
jgi:hypothetical protein